MSARTIFSVLPIPFSAPSALQSSHLPFCLELTHTHKYASISSATSVQLDQFPWNFLIHTNSTNNANEPPLNYFLNLSHKEQFGARARGGERGSTAALPGPIDPPSSFPAKTYFTKFNYSANMSHMLCGRQGRL